MKVLLYERGDGYEKIPVIVLYNVLNKRFLYSKISNFIMECYWDKEFNTKRDVAIKIQSFLNFSIYNEENIKKVNSIKDLNIDNGEQYLNYLTIKKGIGREAVQRYIRVLNEFYVWLNKYNLIRVKIPDLENKKVYIKGREIECFKSIFKYVNIPPKKINGKLIHTFELEYVPLFLKIASEEYKIIALGIYMQIFGGLRVGDVVSLKKSDIRIIGESRGLLLNVKEDNMNLEKSGSSHVKKVKKAYVFSVIGVLDKLYMQHLRITKNYNSMYVFVNKRGEKLTGAMYSYYFNKIKDKFIDYLKNSNNLKYKFYGKYLEDCKWNTHIGRGIFTNVLSSYLRPNQLAFLRGDSSTDSALSYIETSDLEIKRIEKIINELYRDYL